MAIPRLPGETILVTPLDILAAIPRLSHGYPTAIPWLSHGYDLDSFGRVKIGQKSAKPSNGGACGVFAAQYILAHRSICGAMRAKRRKLRAGEKLLYMYKQKSLLYGGAMRYISNKPE